MFLSMSDDLWFQVLQDGHTEVDLHVMKIKAAEPISQSTSSENINNKTITEHSFLDFPDYVKMAVGNICSIPIPDGLRLG